MQLTQTVDETVETSTVLSSQPVADQRQLRHQLFEDLVAAGYKPKQVRILFDLFDTLSRAVEEEDEDFLGDDAIFRVSMNMQAHDVLDAMMADKAPAAAGSLHEQANVAFLPAGMTFIHDRTDYCVLEARLN
jgi:hypothetical protein